MQTQSRLLMLFVTKNGITRVKISPIILSFCNNNNILVFRCHLVDFSYHKKYNIRQKSRIQNKQNTTNEKSVRGYYNIESA
jgi:hypothetical protein